MASLADVRKGLYDRLDTIPDLREFDGAHINTPCGVVLLNEQGVEYHGAMQGGMVTKEWLVRVYISTALNRVAQQQADDFLSPAGSLSVKAAIEGDQKLDGVVDSLIVREGRERFFVEPDGLTYYGVELTCSTYD